MNFLIIIIIIACASYIIIGSITYGYLIAHFKSIHPASWAPYAGSDPQVVIASIIWPISIPIMALGPTVKKISSIGMMIYTSRKKRNNTVTSLDTRDESLMEIEKELDEELKSPLHHH